MTQDSTQLNLNPKSGQQSHPIQSQLAILAHLRNDELLSRIITLAKEERRITLAVLLHLKEIERRFLYAELAYSSLFEFTVKHLHYSESAAIRRIHSMRFLKDLPEVASKIADGTVNITTLAKAQSILRAQEKISGQKITVAEKQQIIEEIEQRSTNDTAKILFERYPDAAKQVEQTRQVVINQNTTRISVNLSNEAMAAIDRAKELLSHAIPDQDLGKIIARLAKDFIRRNDPLLKKPRLP